MEVFPSPETPRQPLLVPSLLLPISFSLLLKPLAFPSHSLSPLLTRFDDLMVSPSSWLPRSLGRTSSSTFTGPSFPLECSSSCPSVSTPTSTAACSLHTSQITFPSVPERCHLSLSLRVSSFSLVSTVNSSLITSIGHNVAGPRLVLLFS